MKRNYEEPDMEISVLEKVEVTLASGSIDIDGSED